jgi:predicted nucleic acid-binding protein
MKSVYLDSTIPSYYFDRREPIRALTDITRKWWDTARAHYRCFISEVTIAELQNGPYPNQDRTVALVRNFKQLEPRDEIVVIAETYVKQFVMPKKTLADALHLAYASFYRIDFLLTWNCEHLANANKDQHIHIVNKRIGLSTPRIVTPMQLFAERGAKDA